MEIKEQIAVMQGFADGKEVEFKAKDSSCWKTPNRNTFKPVWNWHEYYYRIKPEPPVKEIKWGIYSETNKTIYCELFLQKGFAEHQCKEWNAIAKCENTYRVVKLQLTEIQEDAA